MRIDQATVFTAMTETIAVFRPEPPKPMKPATLPLAALLLSGALTGLCFLALLLLRTPVRPITGKPALA